VRADGLTISSSLPTTFRRPHQNRFIAWPCHACFIFARRSPSRTGTEKGFVMPKNQFQRPAPVIRTHNVPRHGTQPPVRKAEVKLTQPRDAHAALPSLEELLAKSTRH
jgi:hypothetical protein